MDEYLLDVRFQCTLTNYTELACTARCVQAVACIVQAVAFLSVNVSNNKQRHLAHTATTPFPMWGVAVSLPERRLNRVIDTVVSN